MTTPKYIRLTAPLNDHGCYHPAGSVARRVTDTTPIIYAIAPAGTRHTVRSLPAHEPCTESDYAHAMSESLSTVPRRVQDAIDNNAYYHASLHDNREEVVETPMGNARVTAWDKRTASLRVDEPVTINGVLYTVMVKAMLRASAEELHVYPYLTRVNSNADATDAAKRQVRESLCPLLETWFENNYGECVQAHYEAQENQVVRGLAALAEYERVIEARRQKLLHILEKTETRRPITDDEQRFLGNVSGWSMNLRW